MGFPLPPRPMGLLPPREMIDPARSQPPPQGLGTERDPMPLGQLLRRQRRPKVPIPLRIPRQHRGLDLVRNPPVRRLPPSPMRQPLVARLSSFTLMMTLSSPTIRPYVRGD